MPKTITVLRTDGSKEILNQVPTYNELVKTLGGRHEIVTVLDHVSAGHPVFAYLLVNETGLIDNLPRNDLATEYYQRLVKWQWFGHENPLLAAQGHFFSLMAQKDFKVMDATPQEAKDKGYDKDPHICGDAVLYCGFGEKHNLYR